MASGPGQALPAAIGLLTRTLSDSPVVNAILPLSSQNDFLRIGHDTVQRCSWNGDRGVIEHLPVVCLQCRIVSATVLQNQSWSSDEMAVDRNDSKEDPTSSQAPDTVLLALDNGTLDVWSCGGSHNDFFKRMSCPLPRSQDPLQAFGKHMVGDPRQRTLAVAAPERGLFIFDIQRDSRGDLVALERVFGIDIDDASHLLHMDYLSGPEDIAILLTILLVGRRLSLQIYEWPHQQSSFGTKPNQRQRLHIGGSLSPEHQFTDLLIPLFRPYGAFVVAAAGGLFLITEVLAGHAKSRAIYESKSRTTQSAIWVAWTRCQSGSILVFRNDGLTVKLDRSPHTSNGLTSLDSEPIATTVCTEFPLVPRVVHPLESGDSCEVFLAFAEDGENGVFQLDVSPHHSDVSSQAVLTQLASSPGYAGCIDLVCASGERKQPRPTRVFATSAGHARGRVNELRPGSEAVVAASFDLSEDQPPTLLSTFSSIDHSLAILLSPKNISSTGAKVMAFEQDGTPFLDDTLSGIAASDSTVASFDGEFGAIQVTAQHVRLISGIHEDAMTDDHSLSVESNETIAAADILLKAGDVHLVLIIRSSSEIATNHLEVVSLLKGKTWIRDPSNRRPLLPHEITAAKVFLQDDVLNCLVSDVTGHLQWWKFGPETMHSSYQLGSDSNSVTTAAEAIMVAQKVVDGTTTSCIICGLRNGQLKLLLLGEKDGEPHMTHLDTIMVGTTTVTLSTLLSLDDSRFVAACGDRLYLVTIPPLFEAFRIEPLWLTDRTDESIGHESISAVTQIRQHLYYHGWDSCESLIVIMGATVYLARIKESSGAVIRSIHGPRDSSTAFPNRVLYSNDLAHFVTSSIQRPTTADASQSIAGPRYSIEYRSVLKSKSEGEAFTYSLPTGEKVFALGEWVFARDEGKHVFTMVATGLLANPPAGRIHILRPSLKAGRIADVELVTSLKFDDPVYCLVVVDESKMFCGHGSHISYSYYSRNKKKWKVVCTYKLSSPAIAISTDHGDVHITTATHSMVTLQLVDRQGYFRLRCTDVVSEPGAHHFSLPVSADKERWSDEEQSWAGLNILSSKRGHLRGLAWGNSDGTEAAEAFRRRDYDLTFSAQLTRSIMRLGWLDVSLDPTASSHGLIGLCTDGTIYGLSLLSAHDWARLKYLEVLIRRSHLWHKPDPALERDDVPQELSLGFAGLAEYEGETNFEFRTGGFTGSAARSLVRPKTLIDGADDSNRKSLQNITRPSRINAEDMHVNGDILGLLVQSHYSHSQPGSPETVLEKMLESEAQTRTDRIATFIRQRMAEELQLVPEIVALTRRALRSWGWW